ncbi:uncharacterized protein ATNIH1004_005760 [Aspergillus tanneri]|uniref:Uncharacterized protein n=1 Tax=Aspergillus tanneri TaxID=1220188 RepID=A0A5M9MXA3_9EURO|nr:uncharacterized protein ATNIH1004_005760 [Aspergillus tanneri]KAA8647077.1 hypothetical protein ATNIH1004_005760 [Aspergillus tanneri]
MRFTTAFVMGLVAIANIAAAIPISSADNALVIPSPNDNIKERDAQQEPHLDAQRNNKRDPQRDGQCYSPRQKFV